MDGVIDERDKFDRYFDLVKIQGKRFLTISYAYGNGADLIFLQQPVSDVGFRFACRLFSISVLVGRISASGRSGAAPAEIQSLRCAAVRQ